MASGLIHSYNGPQPRNGTLARTLDGGYEHQGVPVVKLSSTRWRIDWPDGRHKIVTTQREAIRQIERAL